MDVAVPFYIPCFMLHFMCAASRSWLIRLLVTCCMWADTRSTHALSMPESSSGSQIWEETCNNERCDIVTQYCESNTKRCHECRVLCSPGRILDNQVARSECIRYCRVYKTLVERGMLDNECETKATAQVEATCVRDQWDTVSLVLQLVTLALVCLACILLADILRRMLHRGGLAKINDDEARNYPTGNHGPRGKAGRRSSPGNHPCALRRRRQGKEDAPSRQGAAITPLIPPGAKPKPPGECPAAESMPPDWHRADESMPPAGRPGAESMPPDWRPAAESMPSGGRVENSDKFVGVGLTASGAQGDEVFRGECLCPVCGGWVCNTLPCAPCLLPLQGYRESSAHAGSEDEGSMRHGSYYNPNSTERRRGRFDGAPVPHQTGGGVCSGRERSSKQQWQHSPERGPSSNPAAGRNAQYCKADQSSGCGPSSYPRALRFDEAHWVDGSVNSLVSYDGQPMSTPAYTNSDDQQTSLKSPVTTTGARNAETTTRGNAEVSARYLPEIENRALAGHRSGTPDDPGAVFSDGTIMQESQALQQLRNSMSDNLDVNEYRQEEDKF